jgi:quercetin dioxygenase-like cupin family protein
MSQTPSRAPRFFTWKRILFALVGLPLLVFLAAFIAILGFAAFLPELDRSVPIRADRTIVNELGDYKVTFLKTTHETAGAYEFVQVELAPGGGNEWHYHNVFVEKFHVLQGQLSIGLDGKAHTLTPGQRVEAPMNTLHRFYNTSSDVAVFTVEINPARGFEKTLRIGYGLCNDGHCNERGIPRNPWHLFLMLAYSESYLPVVPSSIQESLIPALARIAQWKGEHHALEPYYR